MAAITNPTQLTPPRVAFIDERSGAISREWYRFFLSLLTAIQDTQDEALAPDANALLASYDALLASLAQTVEQQPDSSAAIASLEDRLDDATQSFAITPRAELGTMAALQQANLPWFTFNTAPSPTPTAVGSVYWDGGTTVGVQMTANVLGRVNEDLYYYIKASSAITKGQVVMFTGAVGSSGVATGAPATGVTNGSYIMGIAAESIANNGFGLVQYNGTLKGVDTSAFADGDILWYDPAVTGGLTKTEPSAPNVKVQVAAVINAGSGGSGSILIRVTAGSVLGGTDSNVQFGTLASGDVIQYDAGLQYWKNKQTLDLGSASTFDAGFGPVGLSIRGTGANSFAAAARFSADVNSAGFVLAKSRGASVTSRAIVANNDNLGSIQWRGDDGTNWVNAARISAEVDGTPGTNDMPGRLVFSTTPDGSSTLVECMRLTSAGNVKAGLPSLATTATDGFFYIPTCNGTPTGTPTTIAGFAPMVVDDVNNKLYVYIGGAWQAMN